MSKLPLISFTGIDDHTDLSSFYRLAHSAARDHKLQIEPGVLIYPEKTGLGRNPSYATRHAVMSQMPTAAHLCGKDFFRYVLDDEPTVMSAVMNKLAAELQGYQRIQLNINARQDDFTEDEVHQVYLSMFNNFSCPIILQYHERSMGCILRFIEKVDAGAFKPDILGMLIGSRKTLLDRLQILVDGSTGTGKSPESWKIPEIERLRRFAIGMAGGITPDNFIPELKRFIADNGGAPSWIDGESGYRYFTDEHDRTGKFSVAKCAAAISNLTTPTQAS